MPVSKKRKKDGKPVHRSVPKAAPEVPAEGGDPTAAAAPVATRTFGKPSNPFVARQTRRAAQRGR